MVDKLNKLLTLRMFVHRLQILLQKVRQKKSDVLVQRQPELSHRPAPQKPVPVLQTQKMPQNGHEERRWVYNTSQSYIIGLIFKHDPRITSNFKILKENFTNLKIGFKIDVVTNNHAFIETFETCVTKVFFFVHRYFTHTL